MTSMQSFTPTKPYLVRAVYDIEFYSLGFGYRVGADGGHLDVQWAILGRTAGDHSVLCVRQSRAVVAN